MKSARELTDRLMKIPETAPVLSRDGDRGTWRG